MNVSSHRQLSSCDKSFRHNVDFSIIIKQCLNVNLIAHQHLCSWTRHCIQNYVQLFKWRIFKFYCCYSHVINLFHFHFLMLLYLSIESSKKNRWMCKHLFNAHVLHFLIHYNMHHVFCVYAFLYYVLRFLVLIIWLYLAVIWILSRWFLRCFYRFFKDSCILHDHILTCSLLQECFWNR